METWLLNTSPWVISAVCSSFIQCRESIIVWTVTEPRKYSANLPQRDLEALAIVAILTFTNSKDKEGEEARKLLESTLSKATIVKCENVYSTETSNDPFGAKEVNPPVNLDITTVESVDEVSEQKES